MNKLTVILMAVALLSPAFAQRMTFQGTHTTTFQGTHPRSKVAIVAPASRPVLMYTGRQITPDQKQQLMATVTKGSAPRTLAGANRFQSPLQSEINMLTPDQLFVNGVYIDAFGAHRVDQFDGILSFQPGPGSSMVLNVTVKANTAYTLVMKVSIDGAVVLPQNTQSGIIISTYSGSNPGTGVNSPQTINAVMGENEFAYSFVSNVAGNLPITINSPDLYWSFESCEITSAAF
jgi:hypothetical protein